MQNTNTVRFAPARARRSGITLRSLYYALLAFATGSVSYAHTYVQLPLIVDVLVGEGISDATIRARVDGLNKIIGQCGNISCTLVKINHNWPDNSVPGDGAGEERPNGRSRLRDDGEKELADKGDSTKFFVAHSLRNADGSNMDGVNGVTVNGRAVSIIADENGDDRTWAHEFAHQMGLDHNNIPGNLMEDPRPAVGAGTTLTEDQCKTMLDNILKHTPIVEQTIDELNETVPQNWVATVSATDVWTPSTPATYVRSLSQAFNVTTSNATMVVNLRLAGVLVSGSNGAPASALYKVAYDTDQNAATGQPVGGYPGMDRLIQINVQASVSGAFGFAQMMDLQHGQSIGTFTAQVIRLSEYTEATNSYTPLNVADSIQLIVPLSLMGPLTNPCLAMATSESSLGNNTLPPAPIATVVPPRPPVTLDPLAAYPQQAVSLGGQNFAPGSTLQVSINHQVVQTLTNDTTGAFKTTVATPALAVGDYFLDVVDDQGNLNMKVLRVNGVALSIQRSGPMLTLSWPVLAGSNTLQRATALNPSNWQDITATQVVVGTNYEAIVSPDSAVVFYRLMLGP